MGPWGPSAGNSLRSNGVAGCDKPLTDCEKERLFKLGRGCGVGTPGGPHPGPNLPFGSLVDDAVEKPRDLIAWGPGP